MTKLIAVIVNMMTTITKRFFERNILFFLRFFSRPFFFSSSLSLSLSLSLFFLFAMVLSTSKIRCSIFELFPHEEISKQQRSVCLYRRIESYWREPLSKVLTCFDSNLSKRKQKTETSHMIKSSLRLFFFFLPPFLSFFLYKWIVWYIYIYIYISLCLQIDAKHLFSRCLSSMVETSVFIIWIFIFKFLNIQSFDDQK